MYLNHGEVDVEGARASSGMILTAQVRGVHSTVTSIQRVCGCDMDACTCIVSLFVCMCVCGCTHVRTCMC